MKRSSPRPICSPRLALLGLVIGLFFLAMVLGTLLSLVERAPQNPLLGYLAAGLFLLIVGLVLKFS